MNQNTITLGIYIIIVAFIVLRMLRERRIRVGPTMWISPLLLLVIVAFPLEADKLTSPADIVEFVIAALVGAGIGWWQSTHSAIRADKAAGFLYVKSSPWGVLIFAAAFLARAAVRIIATDFTSQSAALFWSTLAIFFAIGILAGMRVHWQREYAQATS
jgi:hypothetical protein